MKDTVDSQARPYEVIGKDRPGSFVITCDHATNRVPPEIDQGNLGLPAAEMGRHIAFDIGAAGVTRGLAAALNAPAILSNFSRLVIDPNRGEDDPTLIMPLYDGTLIPANRRLSPEDRQLRLERFYRPYHQAYADLVARRSNPIVVAIHSFTPQLRGRPMRPWDIGLLSANDRRFSDPLMTLLRAEADLCVGDNEPYAGHLPGDAVDQQALRHGHANVLLEIRHDHIETEAQQVAWAKRLAPLLVAAAQKMNAH